MKKLALALFAASLLTTPALALSYPVQGRYGESSEIKPGPIDCSGKRVISFEDIQRFDSNGGVPAFRMIDLVRQSDTEFRITEAFATGQINAQNKFTLRLVDPDRIDLELELGGTIKLKRCA